MIRRFAFRIPDGANALFTCHPLELSTLLELAWRAKAHDPNLDLGRPAHRSDIGPIRDEWLEPFRDLAHFEPPTGQGGPDLKGTTFESALGPFSNPPDKKRRSVFWDHLIYAYMIENTRIYEIFRRVLHEYLHGERLGVPLRDAQHWLRNTEELFYHEPPPFFITNIASHIRPDHRSYRRNVYQRMFGMDLNHGTDDGQAYPYVKADAANNEFVSVFEEFLREVWIGIEHFSNASGAKPTDDAKIADLAERLHDMLISRRVNGNVSREEFVFVSMMSWFHLTVEFNSPIVESLRAEAASPEERLFKIAQRVGLPAHGHSKAYFDIADAMSRVLILIETGIYNTPEAAPAFYTRPGPLESTMRTIIRYWAIITGRDPKAKKVVTSPGH